MYKNQQYAHKCGSMCSFFYNSYVELFSMYIKIMLALGVVKINDSYFKQGE